MLTPCTKMNGYRDDLSGSADEDMLENTKPNLISYSISTSSSNQTTVSGTTNSDQHDIESGSNTGGGDTDVDSLKTLEGKKLPKIGEYITSREAETSDFTVIKHTFQEDVGSPKLLKEVPSSKCLIEDVEKSSSNNSNSPEFGENTRRSSLSVYNVSNVDSSSNNLSRFASQPQLNNYLETKCPTLTRSFSSITLKARNRAYGHIESKVKHYIKHLKNEKVESSESLSKLEVNNVPQIEEDSKVAELQQEIKRLQMHLEERDVLLEEVQANHHSLLLQYGDAKNRLDQLRFTLVKPPQGMKSVQTESFGKADKEVSTYFIEECTPPIMFSKLVPEIENQSSLQSKVDSDSRNMKGKEKQIESLQEIIQKAEVSDVQTFKANPDLEERGSNELLLNRSDTYSSDSIKVVSTWFPFLPQQPLPEPGCYVSLGSSGNISNHQADNFQHGSEFQEKTRYCPYSVENIAINNEQVEQYECPIFTDDQSRNKIKDRKKGRQREMSPTKGSETYFLPIDKCNCWSLQNCHNDTVEVESAGSYTKFEVNNSPENFCVPPLNLECSKDSTIPFQEYSNSENQGMSEYSLSPRICGSSCSDESVLLERPLFKQATNTDEHKIYYDTPTSYKSIVLNCERERKIFSKRNSEQFSDNVLYDMHTNGPQTSNIKKNQMENHQESKNLQRPCCLEVIASQRSCCHCQCCKRSAGHLISRCENCSPKSLLKKADSEMLPDVMQFLNKMSACAEDLRKRSQAIERFLAHLIETAAECDL